MRVLMVKEASFVASLVMLVGLPGRRLAVVRVHDLGAWSDLVAMSFEWT
jgi:hypothetical protein